MRTRRIDAEQAHYYPTRAYTARGIFAPEVTATNPVVFSDDPPPDDGGGYTPMGSTAQNGFRPVKWYQCTFCGETIRETHVDSHQCEVEQ